MPFNKKCVVEALRRGELKMDERELLNLKKKVDQAKTAVAELTGQKNYLAEELKTTWKCKSIPEAEKMLIKMEKELDVTRTELEDKIQYIKDTYNV
jgi:hypothetical protein